MRYPLAAVPVLALAFIACGDDPTGVSGPYTFSITTELRDASIDLSEPQPYICGYKCIATTEGGEKGEHADWVGGRLEWMIGDSTVYTFPLDTEELWNRFGGPSIGRNQKRNFVRSVSSQEPFDLKVVISARHPSGDILTDSSLVICDFPEEVMNLTQLEGSWKAVKFKWTSTQSAVWFYDLIHGGGALAFDLQTDGTFSGTSSFPVQAGSLTTGTVTGSLAIEDAITVTQANVVFTFTDGPFQSFTGIIFRVADKLYIEATEGVTFDFNWDGIQDAATLEAIFELS
ncbi:hypothetical protein ACFL3Z_01460 [Gemmatimonadota bacterium]